MAIIHCCSKSRNYAGDDLLKIIKGRNVQVEPLSWKHLDDARTVSVFRIIIDIEPCCCGLNNQRIIWRLIKDKDTRKIFSKNLKHRPVKVITLPQLLCPRTGSKGRTRHHTTSIGSYIALKLNDYTVAVQIRAIITDNEIIVCKMYEAVHKAPNEV